MNLELLKNYRIVKEIEDFPIPEKELCERYENLFTGAVNDVLREMNLLYQTLPADIKPLRDEMKVCGIAFTIKGSKSLKLEGEMEFRAKMLEALHDHSFVVWDTTGDDESAQWGEVMTAAAIKRGCRGVAVDGGVRDTMKVLEQKFPVFCKYRTPNGMLGRFRITDYQIPIRIGNVDINPGDVVFGDIDGVIIIPRKLSYEVLLRAEKIKENEKEIKKWVSDGLPPIEVVKRGGYF